MSLSARRAWIEIGEAEEGMYEVFGRSPRGERGLKWPPDHISYLSFCVALREESVD